MPWEALMTDKKDGSDDFKNQVLMDVLLRITALENLLIAKNIVSDPEIQEEITRISKKVADFHQDETFINVPLTKDIKSN